MYFKPIKYIHFKLNPPGRLEIQSLVVSQMDTCLAGVFKDHCVYKFIEGFMVIMKTVQKIWLTWYDYSKVNPALSVSVRWIEYIKIESCF